MRIIKEGRVVFERGRIVEITGFELNGSAEELRNYVLSNYSFMGKCGDSPIVRFADEETK